MRGYWWSLLWEGCLCMGSGLTESFLMSCVRSVGLGQLLRGAEKSAA
jgi:hypothetical protein